MHDRLFEPLQLGELRLANRVVMAPMTRSRANVFDEPDELHAAYYGQRASAGLIIAEGTYPSLVGKGYCRTPGIATPGQVEAWRRVTDTVRTGGASQVLQLMHVGRVASRHNKPEGVETVAPSAIAAQGSLYSDSHGLVPMELPRALETAEIAGVIEEYCQAAVNARQAGFDGVELHCSSGYLAMQFLLAGSIRDDGPLPDVVTDVIEAQRKMREQIRDVTFCLMIATTLHSIAVGNLLPAWVRVVCVDINPSTVIKLNDRGSFQTIGLVTDVEPFLRSLVQEVHALEGRQP